MSDTRATLAQQGLEIVERTLAMRRQSGRFWASDLLADLLLGLPAIDLELTSRFLEHPETSRQRIIFDDGSAIVMEEHLIQQVTWVTTLRALARWQDD